MQRIVVTSLEANVLRSLSSITSVIALSTEDARGQVVIGEASSCSVTLNMVLSAPVEEATVKVAS